MENVQKILIVDDEDIVRTVITKAFKFSREYEIIEASTGNEGLEKARAHRPDLIILDWTLPGIQGIEVLKELRKEPELKDIPVIMLTGRDSIEDKLTGLHKGANEYIVKPFDVRELLAHTEKLLTRSVRSSSTERPEPPELHKTNEQERYEWHIAGHLQQKAISSAPPCIKGFEIEARLIPARGAGTDYFDIYLPTETHCIITAGKVHEPGLPGAQALYALRSFLRCMADRETSPGILMLYAAKFLEHYDVTMTTSLVIATLDLNTGSLLLSSAGVIKPQLVSGSTSEELEECQNTRLTSGLTVSFREAILVPRQGESLILSTTGLIDPRWLKPEETGSAGQFLKARQISDHIIHGVTGGHQREEQAPATDITVLVLGKL